MSEAPVEPKLIYPETFEDKVFLVAGAAGLVPSHVCEFYLQKGATVIGLDNFITGSKLNLERLEKFPKFKFIENNIYLGLPEDIIKPGFKIDYIMSLASPASPLDFATIPLEIMRVNSEGTMALLELAKDKKARFLEASTSEVYGDPDIHPQVETYHGNVNPIGPRSCYDESKRYAEALTMTYNRKFGVDTRIIRIFNTYGPGMRPNDGRVIPNFINQAIEGKDLTVYGDGKQTRSFCFVTDLVRAMDQVLFSNDPTPYNIGNPDEYTILEAAEMIIKVLGSSSKISYQPLIHQDDPKKRRPDITKLKKLGNFTPEVSFEDGMRRTAEFFKFLKNQ